MILLTNIFFFILLIGVVIHSEPYVNEKEQDALIRQKRAVIQTKFKFDIPVKYYIGPFLNSTSVQLAIKKIEDKTCIQFEQQSWYIKGTGGFNLKRGYICHSPFGPKVGDEDYENYVLLSNKCEHDVGVIEILIGTMLGLVFEHNRPDRDRYVTVNFQNINPLHYRDFDKYNDSDVETYGMLYDFYSGLHIFSKNFSKNGKAVLERKSEFEIHGLGFGQSYGLSFNDYKTLFKRYCEYRATDKKYRPNRKYDRYDFPDRQCSNYGYLKSNKYGYCICPSGFQGEYCDEPITDFRACDREGHNVLIATNENKTVELARKGHCSYHIKAPKYHTYVKIRINVSKTPNATTCYPDKGHEIKYQWDKGTTGITLCGEHHNLDLTSDDRLAVIIYNGVDNNCKLKFTYSLYDSRTTLAPPYSTSTPTTTTTSIKTTTKKRRTTKRTKKPKPQKTTSKKPTKTTKKPTKKPTKPTKKPKKPTKKPKKTKDNLKKTIKKTQVKKIIIKKQKKQKKTSKKPTEKTKKTIKKINKKTKKKKVSKKIVIKKIEKE
uniref:Metalloendopeptidase n=1 Tax=Strongyloides venezuelensis TaxID=75913 RepID=A0A0K0FQJ4_STRVS